MKSYDLGYIHSIPGRFYTGTKTMGESSVRKRFMQTLYIANLQPFKNINSSATTNNKFYWKLENN